ncbi:hypothetical protein SanaruYs_00890 [Chryseotalea sanaruensis]|uniref:Uncharacterized protein n=1 Tax=Chryseotalea sanaruensis TaxID=2482724 RepID=A0A401U4T8_9BACT|nr:hypothetical protein [Chryseotalea sanaruensis]GCC49875.1 hypothetical protein SanaruYs_00890 [Chryseotalea sanaruensis]
MNRFILILLIIVSACQSEDNADLANENTYIRYFGSQYSHQPQQVIETSDGYLLLNNIQIGTDNQSVFFYKIKLIKTDFYGNLQWEEVYPKFPAENELEQPGANVYSLRGFMIIQQGDNYAIVGEELINQNISSTGSTSLANLALLLVNKDGAPIKDGVVLSEGDERMFTPHTSVSGTDLAAETGNVELEDISITGRGIALNANGNFIVLSSVNNYGTNKMMVTEISTTDLTRIWQRFYGDGIGVVARKIFVNNQEKLVWGGSTESEMRLFTYNQNDQQAISVKPDQPNTTTETASDACEVKGGFSGYALIGTSSTGTDNDMYVVKFSPTETAPIFSKNLDFATGNDEGKAIEGTSDGGLILLGNGASVNTTGNGGTDLFIARLNTIGEEIWTKNYGGSQDEEGACVIQTKDGGYLVLGSSEFGIDFRKVMLLKLDANGDL